MAESLEQRTGRGQWAILILVWALLTVVNLAKPFHIDDTAGLLIAQAIAIDPWHPMGATLNWLDTAEPIFLTNQPHFFFYLTAAMVGLFGNSELVLHLLQSVFSLLAIVAIYQLMRRFVPDHALWATCVSVLGPGFMINQNAMTDIPVLALISLAVLWVTGPGSRGIGIGFGVFSVAILTKYTALFLFPAMIWAAAKRLKNLIWIALPVLVLILWSLFNFYDYGAVHILNRPTNIGGLAPSPKLAFALICNLGLFAAPVALTLMARGFGWFGLWTAGLLLFFLAQVFGLGHPAELLMVLNAMLFASAGVVLLAAFLRIFRLVSKVRTSPEGFGDAAEFRELVLAIWLVGGLGFLSTFPPFMASRHALLLMPPLVILALALCPPSSGKLHWFGIAALWTLFGLFVTANDISFARFYRDQAPILATRSVELANGAQVFTRGHWGWQWYARQTGMVEYDSLNSTLNIGDILVDPVGISSQLVAELADFDVLETITQAPGMFTLLDTHRFYGSGALALPVLAPGPTRQIRILRKTR